MYFDLAAASLMRSVDPCVGKVSYEFGASSVFDRTVSVLFDFRGVRNFQFLKSFHRIG